MILAFPFSIKNPNTLVCPSFSSPFISRLCGQDAWFQFQRFWKNPFSISSDLPELSYTAVHDPSCFCQDIFQKKGQ
jgi:hypothetical protein